MNTDEKQPFDVVPEKLEEELQPSESHQKDNLPEEKQIPEQEAPPAANQQENQIPQESSANQQNQTLQQTLSVPQKETYEEYIHDPWTYVTAPTPPVPSVSSTVGSLPGVGGTLPTPPPAGGRFTRARVLTFAALCVIIIMIFGGTAFALVGTMKTPAQAAPARRQIQQVQPTIQPTLITPAPTMTTDPKNVLQDTFHRDQDVSGSWGTASNANGQAWQITTRQRAPAFSVVGNVGQITANQASAAFYTATLGPAIQNGEVSATFTLQSFNQQQSNVGVILHWQDANHYDKALIDGAHLIILENRGGQQTTLMQVAFPAASGTAYTIRFRSANQTLMAKAWESQQPEPMAWAALTTAGKLTSGQAGVRARLQSGDVVHVTAFQIVAF
jgi:hypothetical protein